VGEPLGFVADQPGVEDVGEDALKGDVVWRDGPLGEALHRLSTRKLRREGALFRARPKKKILTILIYVLSK